MAEKKPEKGIEKDEKRKQRFRQGKDDLEQLTGIEKQQQRSRKVRRSLDKTERDGSLAELPPLIDRIDKSKNRVRNRLNKVKDHDDALREFGS